MPTSSRARRAVERAIALLRPVVRPEVARGRLEQAVANVDRAAADQPWPAPSTIAIVVPCYGHADHLGPMFESIRSQRRPADEVVIVDDCSPDDTGAIVRELMAGLLEMEQARYSLLTNERNLGQAASINRAVAATSSDLVMILNDDDVLMDDAVEAVLDAFRSHPDLALVGAGSIHVRSDPTPDPPAWACPACEVVHDIRLAGDDALRAAPRLSTAYPGSSDPLTVSTPSDARRYRRFRDLNMTHSGSTFRRAAWALVGGYEPALARRVVPFSDRDFQLRVNAIWPVGVAARRPLAFWRADRSVDASRNS